MRRATHPPTPPKKCCAQAKGMAPQQSAGPRLRAKVRRWIRRSLAPEQLRQLRAAREAGRVRPLRGKEEWQFVYAMSRVHRADKMRLPTHLRATAARILDQVSNIHAPLPLAWAVSAPAHSRFDDVPRQSQRRALQRLLVPGAADAVEGGGGESKSRAFALSVPPWVENVPPVAQAASPAPAVASPAPSVASPAPSVAAAPAVAAPAPAMYGGTAGLAAVSCTSSVRGRCMGMCRAMGSVAACAFSKNDYRCTQTERLHPLCDASGKVLSTRAAADAAWIRSHAAAVLDPRWAALAPREGAAGVGAVLLCPAHADALRAEMRARHPLEAIKRGAKSAALGAARGVLKADDWMQQGSSLASMGAQMAAPALDAAGLRDGAEAVRALDKKAKSAYAKYTPSGNIQQAGETVSSKIMETLGISSKGQVASLAKWAAGSGAALKAKEWVRDRLS